MQIIKPPLVIFPEMHVNLFNDPRTTTCRQSANVHGAQLNPVIRCFKLQFSEKCAETAINDARGCSITKPFSKIYCLQNNNIHWVIFGVCVKTIPYKINIFHTTWAREYDKILNTIRHDMDYNTSIIYKINLKIK